MAKQNKKQTIIKPDKEPTDEQLQGNQHDKIIKESIEETMHFMLKTFGNIDVVRSEQLPTEIQQTQERKPDFLKIIVDSDGVERIGHIEFHVKDEADISYRAFEICAMMKRKKPLLDIQQIIVKTDLEQLKFLAHLRIWGKLRNFEPLINKIMEETIAYFGLKDEDDYMYKKAEAKAEIRLQKERADAQKRLEQTQRFTVIGLLDIPNLTEAQISVAVGISAGMIHLVKKDLAAAPKKIDRLKQKLSAKQIAEQLNLPVTWVEKYIQST